MPEEHREYLPTEFSYQVIPSKEIRKWWCVQCRNFLFFSHHNLVKVSEEGSLDFLKPPLTIICSKCRAQIHIQEII